MGWGWDGTGWVDIWVRGTEKMRGCGGGMGWGRSPGWLDTTSGARYAGVPTRLVGALCALESLEKPKSASCSSRDRGWVVEGVLVPDEQGGMWRLRPAGLASSCRSACAQAALAGPGERSQRATRRRARPACAARGAHAAGGACVQGLPLPACHTFMSGRSLPSSSAFSIFMSRLVTPCSKGIEGEGHHVQV